MWFDVFTYECLEVWWSLRLDSYVLEMAVEVWWERGA